MNHSTALQKFLILLLNKPIIVNAFKHSFASMSATVKRKSASAMLQELGEERRKKLSEPTVRRLEGWEEVDIDHYNYRVEETHHIQAGATLNMCRNATMLDIFEAFLTPELLQDIWTSCEPDWLSYGSSKHRCRVNRGNFSLKLIYQWLAIHIRVIGRQCDPKEGHRKKNPLRESLTEGMEYFMHKYQNAPKKDQPPGITILETINSSFCIHNAHFPQLSCNFQSIIEDMGQLIAGDEKLFKLTSKSNDVREVPSKPDKIGLWFYELMVTFECGLPFMVHMALWSIDKRTR